jgi:hypothetical protein
MFRGKRLIIGLLIWTLVLAGCAAQAQGPDRTVSHGNEIGGYAEFVDALRSEGAQVEPLDAVKQPFFDISGPVLLVNGSRVQVFDFGEERFQRAAAEQISADGFTIDRTVVDWADQPNFWAKDRIIVLYVGTDPETLGLLNRVLGDPITESVSELPGDPPYAVVASEQELGEAIEIPVDEIDFVSYERVEWPDACLGFAESGEMCAEVLTPGWLVILEAEGQRYEFHTDKNGEKLRWRPQTGDGDVGYVEGSDPATVDGLTITIDVHPAVATGVERIWVPATHESENAPNWVALPEHLHLDFENYVREHAFHRARLYVYPVSTLEAANDAAAEQVARLRAVLEERPLEMTDDLPFLPLLNAGQMIESQFEYWAFESGTGMRFVTQYGQAVGPINNHELFYSFQGLTYDGDYYVAAILPVSHPDLPADSSAMPEGNWERYIRGVEQQLDAADPSSFEPDLAVLDQMIRTLKIDSQFVGSGRQTDSPAFECTVFYRPDTTAEGQAQSQETTVFLAGGDQETVAMEDLVWKAQYGDNAFEGVSLVISVATLDSGRQVMRQLYQLSPESQPNNQFAGGHGFTGLNYVYHPVSTAELQYYCQSR